MQNQERLSPNETQGTLARPLSECSKILDAMTSMSLRLGKPMSSERMNQLLADLEPYPVSAILWAFDSWGRSAKVMPVLSDLLQLLRTWHTDHVQETCECTVLHGTGYGTDDIRWLLQERGKHAKRFSILDWEELFAELDKKRAGGAPKWRETPEGQQFLRV